MKFKKLTAFILAGALMAAQVASVSAENTEVLDGVIEHDLGVQAEGEYGIMLISEDESLPIEEEGASYVNISGKITEITKTEEGIVESILVEKGENDEVALIISEETVAVDSEGMPIDLASLEVGGLIDATQSMAQTMSLPPQSAAIAIIAKAEDKISPKYMEIKSIDEVDGKTAFESEDGNYLIAIDENTEFVPYKTRNIVTAADLKADSKVLVWYDISTKSIPEQAVAQKVMILPADVEQEAEIIEKQAMYVNISGKIAEITKTEEGIVESILVEKGENDEVALIISEETVAVDSEGMPIDLASLEVGGLIDATQSMAQTMSLPPQSAAIAIIAKAEDKISPKYMEIKSIDEVDGKTAFESLDGNYLIAIDENTEFVPYKTRNIVTAADLKADSKVLVWYDISTKSIPEQAVAQKVMILPVVEEDKELVIVGAEIAGAMIDFAKYDNVLPTVEEGITYLPIRAIAETIGATVSWDGATQTVVIEKDDVKAELKIGSDKAVVAGEEVTLAAAPKIVDDRTVVGVSVDLDKYGMKLITE